MTDHRQLSVDLFNHTWSLIDNPKRTPEQDEDRKWLHKNLDEIALVIDAN